MVRSQIVSRKVDLDDSALDLSVVEPNEVSQPEKQPSHKPLPSNQVPPKNILNSANLKKLKSYRKIRQNIKSQNDETLFINQVSEALDMLNVEESKYDYELLLLVMQIAENWFLKSKDGNRRKAIVILACKKFFDGNEELISKSIELLMPNLEQNKFISRNIKKLLRYAENALKRCWQK